MAVASLVAGVVWFCWQGSILALIFGYLAKAEINRNPCQLSGRSMAIAGIVLGWVEIGGTVVLVGAGLIVYLINIQH